MIVPKKIDLLLVGSGPHNLTVASFLTAADSSWVNRLAVVDPSGAWLTRWDQQMAAQEIVHLRSSSVHHPDPDPLALRQFAKGRESEFYPPYALPGVRVFRDFCTTVIARHHLEERVFKGTVARIWPQTEGFRVVLSDGRTIEAASVALALGGGRPRIPDFAQPWMDGTGPQILHSNDIDLTRLEQGSQRIAIVGSGLTAGHLALGALRRGHQVALLSRHTPQFRLFDVAPGWIGPKFLTKFYAEPNLKHRAHMIKKARGHGAMTEEFQDLLAPYRRSGQLNLKPHYQVNAVNHHNGTWQLNSGYRRIPADQVWLCTGTQLNLREIDFLNDLHQTHPLDYVEGFPVLDASCRWPGLALYLSGLPAAMTAGPATRNLPGARQVASRIVAGLTGVHVPAN